MKFLMTMMNSYQDINITEKGVSFAEEGFTQLYDEVVKVNKQYEKLLDGSDTAGRNGMLIGAVGMGLVGLSAIGISKLIKHKLKDEKEVEVNLDEVRTFKPEVVKMDEDSIMENVKEISNKNRKALANIITEVTKNEKKGIK